MFYLIIPWTVAGLCCTRIVEYLFCSM